VERLQAEGVRARMVPVNYASHCAHVEVLRERLLAEFAGITPRSSQIAFCSTVTGELIDTSTMDAAYWYRLSSVMGRVLSTQEEGAER